MVCWPAVAARCSHIGIACSHYPTLIGCQDVDKSLLRVTIVSVSHGECGNLDASQVVTACVQVS